MASYRYGISIFIVHFYLILNMAYFKEILMKTENTYIKYKGTKSSAWHCTRVHARCCVTQNFKRWNIEMIDFHFETPSPPKMKLIHLLVMIDKCESPLSRGPDTTVCSRALEQLAITIPLNIESCTDEIYWNSYSRQHVFLLKLQANYYLCVILIYII